MHLLRKLKKPFSLIFYHYNEIGQLQITYTKIISLCGYFQVFNIAQYKLIWYQGLHYMSIKVLEHVYFSLLNFFNTLSLALYVTM